MSDDELTIHDQVDAFADGELARAPEEKLPPIISLAARRRRIVIATVSTLSVAAAAMVIVWRAARPEPIMLAQATERPIESRLSYADRYRPYDVARAAATAREEIPLDTLAKLEKRGELRGLADGYLLGGEPDRAAELLSRA